MFNYYLQFNFSIWFPINAHNDSISFKNLSILKYPNISNIKFKFLRLFHFIFYNQSDFEIIVLLNLIL